MRKGKGKSRKRGEKAQEDWKRQTRKRKSKGKEVFPCRYQVEWYTNVRKCNYWREIGKGGINRLFFFFGEKFRRSSSNFYFLKKVLDIFKKSDIIDTVRKTTVNPYNNFEWRLKNEYLCFRHGNHFPWKAFLLQYRLSYCR